MRCQGNSDVPSATAHIQDTAAFRCLLTDSFDEAVLPTTFHAKTDAAIGAVIGLGICWNTRYTFSRFESSAKGTTSEEDHREC